MDDISSLWTFHEVEELKEKLQYVTYELEITRKEANEEMRKKNEHLKKLLHLLQTVIKERDEAKSQLQKLEQQQIIPSFNNQFIPATGPFSPDSPLLTNYPNRTNSGITESNNSLSFETTNNNNPNNNHQNRVSSPVVDSVSVSHPRATSSSDSSNIGLSTLPTPMSTPTGANKVVVVDQATLMIDNLAKGKPRPQKGKLLQAVLEAGPLLQTLLVAGSLPRWRNPPGSLTAHPIPPVNIKGCVSSNVVGGVASSSKSNGGEFYGQFTTSGSIGVCPSSMLDFGNGASGSCLMGGRFINSGVSFDSQIPKRQRLM